MDAQPTARCREFNTLFQRAVSEAADGAAGNALVSFEKAAVTFPDLWCQLATQLAKDGDEDIALALAQQMLSFSRSSVVRAGALNTIGLILSNRGQTADGLAAFSQAIDLWPNNAFIMGNLALAHRWNGNIEDAARWIRRSLEINPWSNDAQFEQALQSLLQGDYEKGFQLYECRWRSKNNGLQKLQCHLPEWNGSNGRRIFIYGEQGAGDAILMMRYARLLKERGLWQAWVFHKGLKPLAATMGIIDELCDIGAPLPDVDCHLPAFSLPRLFKTTIDTIPSAPYLPWVRAASPSPGEPFRVGICWRGSAIQLNDRFRSTNLDQWAPVLQLPGVEFHSLQVDGAEEALLYPQIITHPRPADWFVTANLVSTMDLIITVDTSILHLAGALGIPAWCALHCRPYFVFPLVREHCPWYPSVRLFKQKKEFEWNPIFKQIAQELRSKVGQASSLSPATPCSSPLVGAGA